MPNADYNGPDSFVFAATDPAGASSSAEVTITVIAVNDPPEAIPDQISAPCHGSITGRLHGFDREGQKLSFRITHAPSRGHVTLVNAQTGDFVVYTDGGNDEDASFDFVVSDGEADSVPASLSVRAPAERVRQRDDGEPLACRLLPLFAFRVGTGSVRDACAWCSATRRRLLADADRDGRLWNSRCGGSFRFGSAFRCGSAGCGQR